MNKYLLLLLFPCVVFAQQGDIPSRNIDASFSSEQLDELFSQSEAQFEFFQGVTLYNMGHIPQALLAFQKALSIASENVKDNQNSMKQTDTALNMYKFWFAKANYAYGNEKIAEQLWRELIGQDFLPSYLRNKLEIMQSKKNTSSGIQFSQMSRASSVNLSNDQLSLPMSIKKLNNGNMGLTMIRSNVIALINPTGIIQRFLTKNIDSFNIPIDILQLKNGTIWVSEFGSNSLSSFTTKGTFINSFMPRIHGSSTETFENILIGPQYMAKDNYDNVYISVHGTSEIVKISPDGVLLQRFGGITKAFVGLMNPTGIEVQNNQIWVANKSTVAPELVEFDTSGNYISTIPLSGFMPSVSSATTIESIQSLKNNTLMLTLENAIVKFDSSRKIVVDVLQDSEFSKLTSASFDDNGLLWVSDQGRNTLDIFTNISNLYTGLHMNILSINTDSYPKIRIIFSVQNASGTSITGLTSPSIAVTEDTSPILDFTMSEKKDIEQDTHIMIIPGLLSDIEDAVLNSRLKDSIAILSNSVSAHNGNNTIFSLIKPRVSVPIVVVENTSLANKIIEASQSVDSNVSNKHIYQALRLAVNKLLLCRGNKVIVYVGNINKMYNRQAWNNLEKTMIYHNISLFWINPDDEQVLYADENTQTEEDKSFFHYFTSIVEDTKGKKYRYPFILQGIDTPLLESFFKPDSGEYILEFNSSYDTSYLKQYLSIILTGYFYNSSGQAIGGYILPRFDN